jgi:rod shape-determining protein MreC
VDLSPETGPRAGRVDLLLLVGVLLLGGILASLGESRTAAVTAGLRGTVLSPFLSVHRTMERRSRLADRVDRLEQERDSLARALVSARSRIAESRELRELVKLASDRSSNVMAADLEPGRVRLGGARAFMIRRGSRAGLSAPAGVFTADGVVGVLRWVGAGSARGEFWTHPDFRVSVRTESGEASGIVRPAYEGDQPAMLLEGAPYQTDIDPGTTLYTSGLGGVYPPGVPVGTVRGVSGVESGWEKSYRVEAKVRPEQADVALVWLGEPAPR